MEPPKELQDQDPQVQELQAQDRQDPEAARSGAERRAYPRHSVDCPVLVSLLTGAGSVSGRLSCLSMGGCLVAADKRLNLGIQVRVELQFQLRGIAFRAVGTSVSTRSNTSFAIRFVDMPSRRREELAEILAEVEAVNLHKPVQRPISQIEAEVSPPQPAAPAPQPKVLVRISPPPPAKASWEAASAPQRGLIAPLAPASPPATPRDRRSNGRHEVDTRAKLLLIKAGISMPGRILNLSLGGCRIRTEERFNVGIFVRVEAEFYLHGLPFRVGGVSQSIMDKHTIGLRFLDMSERRRGQLTELMAEIAAAEAHGPDSMPTGNSEGMSDASPPQ